MGNPPLLSLRFAFVLSVSVAASYATTSAAFSFRRQKSQSPSTISVPKATVKDLLTLLGPPQQALSVNEQEAEQLKSCFKFLVPFSPTIHTYPEISRSRPARRSLGPVRLTSKNKKEAEENELIWWPPPPVIELARLAVDSGGNPGVIHRALDPAIIQVPDVEGSKEDRCELTRTSYGRRFMNEELNSYLKSLFKIIEARGPGIGLNVSLNRYNLFHGHLFLAVDSGRLGILGHYKTEKGKIEGNGQEENMNKELQ